MGQTRRALVPHKSPLHLWGAELRALRDRHGLSLAELGAVIFYDPSHLGKFERGERIPPRRIAKACDERLGGTGVLVRLWEAIQASRSTPDRSADEADQDVHEANLGRDGANAHAGLAAVADDPPGLSEDTVSVPVLHDGKVIFVPVSRRALLAIAGATAASITAAPSSSRAASLPVISDVNPIEYFREIRRVLVDTDNLFGPRAVIPTVERQIRAMQDLRSVLQGGDRRLLVQMQASYGEFASWLHEDAGNFIAAQYWTDRALEWSHTSHDPDLTAYILARKAQLAGDMGDAAQVVDVGQAAEELARVDTRLPAIAATYTAHGHALQGDASACAAAYDRAHRLIDVPDVDPASTWGAWLDHAYIEVHRARSLAALGRHQQTDQPHSVDGVKLMRQAVSGFAEAIGRLPVGYHRDRGVYLARQAAAHLGAQEPEEAASTALRALTVGAQTGSARIFTQLTQVDHDLTPWRSLPQVTAFHDALIGTAL